MLYWLLRARVNGVCLTTSSVTPIRSQCPRLQRLRRLVLLFSTILVIELPGARRYYQLGNEWSLLCMKDVEKSVPNVCPDIWFEVGKYIDCPVGVSFHGRHHRVCKFLKFCRCCLFNLSIALATLSWTKTLFGLANVWVFEGKKKKNVSFESNSESKHRTGFYRYLIFTVYTKP